MGRRRRIARLALSSIGWLVAVALLTPWLVASPAVAQDGCTTSKQVPPPPVDTSEVPAPGVAPPDPLPVPVPPIGGPRLGECGLIAPTDTIPVPEPTAASWLVADLDSGNVLASRDPHARQRPASTIKILTALLVIRRLNPQTVVLGSEFDANVPGSRVGIGPGGQYTVRQLLAGLLLNSGNDAAHALAGQLGGDAATVAEMIATARSHGALDTRPATPSGLDGPGMSSSAYDLAALFRVAMREPLFAELVATRMVDFPGWGGRAGYQINNSNKLLTSYPGALGGKTGFTTDARHTYIGAAQRGNQRLVVVLLRGEQTPSPIHLQAARLLDYGFALPPSVEPVGKLVESPPAVPTPEGQAATEAAAGEHGTAMAVAIPTALAATLASATAVALLWTRMRRRKGGDLG